MMIFFCQKHLCLEPIISLLGGSYCSGKIVEVSRLFFNHPFTFDVTCMLRELHV